MQTKPATQLAEDFPEVAEYLESVSATTNVQTPSNAPSTAVPSSAQVSQNYTPSQHAQNQASEAMTSTLMDSVQEIMQRSEAEGTDPDAELRQLVGRTVLQGVVTGYDMTVDPSERRGGDDEVRERDGLHGAKRPKTDDDGAQ